MTEHISSRKVKARKTHPCETCNGVAAKPGDTYHRDVYVGDGRIYTWLQCEACRHMGADVYIWAGHPDEGIGPETYREWADEHRRAEGETGDAARAYWARMSRMDGGAHPMSLHVATQCPYCDADTGLERITALPGMELIRCRTCQGEFTINIEEPK